LSVAPATEKGAPRWQRAVLLVTQDRKRSTVLWLALVTAMSFLLHLPFLNLPMISDEGGYAYVAQRWLDGRGTLYDDLWVSRPQGIFLAYAAIFHTIGTSVVELRIGAWIVGLLTTCLVWRFARELAGRQVAMLATLLFAVISASPALEGFTANAEVFMALPAAAAALMLLRERDHGWRTSRLVAIGALAGAATFLKPSGIVMLPLAILFVLLTTAPGGQRQYIRGGWIAVGFLGSLLPAFIHGYLVGWHNFFFAAVSYRLFHQSSVSNSLAHHAHALFDLLARTWPILAAVLLPIVVKWWTEGRPLNRSVWQNGVAQPQLGIVSWPGRGSRRTFNADGQLLLRFWMAACCVGIAMGGDWWFHYLIQIAAPLSIWFAIKIRDVHALLGRRPRQLLVALIAILLLIPYSVVARGNPSDITKAIYGHPGYPDQLPVARYLMEHSPPGTPIFVGFDQAALYYLADRPAIFRYLYDQELRALPETEAQLIAIIESPGRPMYIVGTRTGAPFPDNGQAFWAAVGRHYHWEVDVKGVPIYRADLLTARRFTPDI
jgi:4-amino-4-deoxy-L-arabinose transferase-like glycosyltransferase